MLFAQEGPQGLYTVTVNDGSRYVPARTHSTHAPTPGTSCFTRQATNWPPQAFRCGSIRGIASAWRFLRRRSGN